MTQAMAGDSPSADFGESTKFVGWLATTIGWALIQLVFSAAITTFFVGFTKAAVLLVVFPLVTMCCCVWAGQPKSTPTVLSAIFSTVFSLTVVYIIRLKIDATFCLGPIPSSANWISYVGLFFIVFFASLVVCFCFKSESETFVWRIRWPVFSLILISLITVAVIARKSIWTQSLGDLIHSIEFFEKKAGGDNSPDDQFLSHLLAVSGRYTEAESVDTWYFGDSGSNIFNDPDRRIELSKLKPLDWRKTIEEIAKREQLILIMEAHNSPRHRQWIEQVLPILHDAGFRDYAAEGISESGVALEQRGYPIATSGVYTTEPSFSNLLRTACKLGFRVHDYEALASEMQARELEQAENLAKLFQDDPDLKLIVHAGYGHVFKRPCENGDVYMAAHLKRLTGIEPFSILQTYHSVQEQEAAQLSELLDPEKQQPLMLMPWPKELTSVQFDVPEDGVNALVIHPPSAGGVSQRQHGFPDQRDKKAGKWNGQERTVVIGVFNRGEQPTAIALDQVMLRGERDFVLWLPKLEQADLPESKAREVRVFGPRGEISNGESSIEWK